MAERSNLWCCVIYPGDSAPDNYMSIIDGWHIPVLLSPIHDKDLNADDTEKKIHQHLLIYFSSLKSYNQVIKYTDQLNGTIPIIVHDCNAMIRYFIHKDNPEKYPYDINDLIPFSGFDYQKAFTNYTSEELIYETIEKHIYENKIYNFAGLVQYLKENHLKYELSFLRKHTVYFNALLNGQYQKYCKKENKEE